MEFSLLLVALIIGHLLADFYWQPMSWVNDRNSRHFKAKKLYYHILVHGVTSAVVVALWEYSFGWQQLSSVLDSPHGDQDQRSQRHDQFGHRLPLLF